MKIDNLYIEEMSEKLIFVGYDKVSLGKRFHKRMILSVDEMEAIKKSGGLMKYLSDINDNSELIKNIMADRKNKKRRKK